MESVLDVFVSYAHHDTARVVPLVRALQKAGLSVWFDSERRADEGIVDFGSIQRSIEEGLARSKTFLAFYTSTYPTRTACQWELTAAWIAAVACGRPDAVMAINGERSVEHIVPVELADRRFPVLAAAAGRAELADVARGVAAHVRGLAATEPLGACLAVGVPRRYGWGALGTDRFVGRFAGLWSLHSLLMASAYPVHTNRVGYDVVVVSGLGGVGKTMLTQQYAARFAHAHPGGVFWLQGSGESIAGGADLASMESELANQLLQLAQQRGLEPADRTVEGLRIALALNIEERAEHCLWVFDDAPDGLSREELGLWLGPHPLARTIITTRVGAYDEVARPLRLGALTPDDAWAVLTRRHRPDTAAEEDAARSIVDELDGHALALDVAGAWLARGSDRYEQYRERLAQVGPEALDTAEQLDGVLPSGHARSVAATIEPSLDRLSEPALALLSVAAKLAPAPIPVSMLVACARAGGASDDDARREVGLAIGELVRLSLADGSAHLVGIHALVRSYAAVRGDVHDLRRYHDAALTAVINATEWPQAQEWCTHARHLSLDPRTNDEVAVLGIVAAFEADRGLRASVSDYRSQVAAYRLIAGHDDARVFAAMDRLAQTLLSFDDLADARLVAEEALAGRQSLFGSTSQPVLDSMNTYAMILSALLNDFEEYGFNRFSGPGTPERGELMRPPTTRAELLRIRERLAAANEALNGPDSPETWTSLANLAVQLADSDRNPEAIPLAERALAGWEKHAGPRHPSTLSAKANLSTMLDWVDPRRLRLQLGVVEIRGDELGLGHPDTLAAMNALAETLTALGELRLARALWAFVSVTADRLFGEDHPVGEHAIWSRIETDKRSHRVLAWLRRRARHRDRGPIEDCAAFVDCLVNGPRGRT